MKPVREPDIARNVRTIEWLKAEIVGGSAQLFRSMLRNSEDAILDSLANVVVACYLLARRLGMTFARLDLKIEAKVKANISKGHEIEEWYGDFSALDAYLTDRAR
ncbi:MAG: MazG-like family protein [Firmicutes bacterium]|nr:MazG-like family protein [Bacillota bacterium]